MNQLTPETIFLLASLVKQQQNHLRG